MKLFNNKNHYLKDEYIMNIKNSFYIWCNYIKLKTNSLKYKLEKITSKKNEFRRKFKNFKKNK